MILISSLLRIPLRVFIIPWISKNTFSIPRIEDKTILDNTSLIKHTPVTIKILKIGLKFDFTNTPPYRIPINIAGKIYTKELIGFIEIRKEIKNVDILGTRPILKLYLYAYNATGTGNKKNKSYSSNDPVKREINKKTAYNAV